MDLTKTILTAAGAPVPAEAKLEGIDLLPLLARDATPVSRTLFWRVVNPNMNQRTVRDGDWKLFIDSPGRAMLYDLRTDVGERNDVSASNTAVVRRLAQLLQAWEKDVDADAKALASATAKPVPERK